MSYAAQLSAIATMTFNDLATRPPGEATDAQLLVLWKSFQPPAHNQEIYKELLEQKIKRYLASGVRDIGRTSIALCGGEDCVAGGGLEGMRDRVVIRVRFKSGSPVRFAFARKDWRYDADNTLPQERAPESQLPLDQDAFHGRPIPNEARLQMRPAFEKFIDPEFVNAAIARHMEVWGREPETIEADDTLWTWDNERAQQAKQTTAGAPGPFGLPKLPLSSGPDRAD